MPDITTRATVIALKAYYFEPSKPEALGGSYEKLTVTTRPMHCVRYPRF